MSKEKFKNTEELTDKQKNKRRFIEMLYSGSPLTCTSYKIRDIVSTEINQNDNNDKKGES